MLVPIHNMPESGQFIAVWSYDGKIWAETLKWAGDVLQKYIDVSDSWETIEPRHPVLVAHHHPDMIYLVYEED